MYRHFASKQDLVVAFLERRDELWTRSWLQGEVEQRSADPREQLLAIFDVFDAWFRTPEFEGCSFINVMLEHPDPGHALHVESSRVPAEDSRLPRRARRTGRESGSPRASPASGTS